MANTGSESTPERGLRLDREVVWAGVAYLAVALARVVLRFATVPSPPSTRAVALMWMDILLGVVLLAVYVWMGVALWRAVSWLGCKPTPVAVVFVGAPVLGIAGRWGARALRSVFPRFGAALASVVAVGIVVAVAATWLYVKRLLTARLEELRRIST